MVQISGHNNERKLRCENTQNMMRNSKEALQQSPPGLSDQN